MLTPERALQAELSEGPWDGDDPRSPVGSVITGSLYRQAGGAERMVEEAALLAVKMEEGAMNKDVMPLEARKGRKWFFLEPQEGSSLTHTWI